MNNGDRRRLNGEIEEDEEDDENNDGLAAWERAYADERSWESLQEDESGLLRPIDNQSLHHAQYCRRLRAATTARIQKGLIRYLYIAIDLSKAASEMDFRPSRMGVVAKHVEAFIREYFKTYDAVVGHITVTADRMDKVEFTQPYMRSGLSMIVPEVTDEEATWMFMKPFTLQMWVVTGSILIYTILIIWFLERSSNPDFDGPLKDQIGTAVWFTFSSLFFAHREKVYSNLTRVTFVVWLFVVLILTSSYTANLSSIVHHSTPATECN